MKIGISSQNFRTITGHAGKGRRFLVYTVDDLGQYREEPRLDLPREMSLHEYHGDDHPLFALDLLVTAGCGDGFRRRMARHGVKVLTTSTTDPIDALQRIIDGRPLPEAGPHDHHQEHDHGR